MERYQKQSQPLSDPIRLVRMVKKKFAAQGD